jgi:glycosyltransferase involved in cell wall biosynthesis
MHVDVSELTPEGQPPLLTFALFAYNQEEFIKEAIEGAFSQTYQPLQIILSDDNSTDRTFEIMTQVVRDYTGPHRIVLNQNRPNLGIGGHINRLMELADGKLIVVAAGDDISLPNRTERIYEVWRDSDMKCFSIHSAGRSINAAGEFLQRKSSPYFRNDSGESRTQYLSAVIQESQYVFGATHAWSSDCFEKFGPLMPGITCEDRAIPFRSVLLGEIGFIDEELVDWRAHESNLSAPDEYFSKGYPYSLRVCRWDLESAVQCRKDILSFQEHHADLIDFDVSEVVRIIERKILESQMRLNLMLGQGTWRTIREFLSQGGALPRVLKEVMKIRLRRIYYQFSRIRRNLHRLKL